MDICWQISSVVAHPEKSWRFHQRVFFVSFDEVRHRIFIFWYCGEGGKFVNLGVTTNLPRSRILWSRGKLGTKRWRRSQEVGKETSQEQQRRRTTLKLKTQQSPPHFFFLLAFPPDNSWRQTSLVTLLWLMENHPRRTVLLRRSASALSPGPIKLGAVIHKESFRRRLARCSANGGNCQ